MTQEQGNQSEPDEIHNSFAFFIRMRVEEGVEVRRGLTFLSELTGDWFFGRKI